MKALSIKEIEAKLKVWQSIVRDVDAQYDAFAALTAASPDCKLWNPIFVMSDVYTDAVGADVGDKHEWLQWYAMENDFGLAGLKVNGAVVENLHQLSKVIKGS